MPYINNHNQIVYEFEDVMNEIKKKAFANQSIDDLIKMSGDPALAERYDKAMKQIEAGSTRTYIPRTISQQFTNIYETLYKLDDDYRHGDFDDSVQIINKMLKSLRVLRTRLKHKARESEE